MKIINKNNKWCLQYKYKIITNRNKKEDNTIYYFYTTQLSCEIINYFGTVEYYVYKKDNKIYLCTEKPVGYTHKKLKARSKYNNSNIRAIPLNPSIFNLVGDVKDKSILITLHLNEKDYVTDDMLVEMKIIN